MEFMPKVHIVPDVMANPYLIIEAGGITLIDTGLPGSHRKILRYLADRGYSAANLTRIILTHADVDHVGGLAALKRASGARIFASPIEAAAIARGKPSRKMRRADLPRRVFTEILSRVYRASPVQVDELLRDGQVLGILGGLQVLETPGHTPGHISLFAPAHGVLFAGDSLMSRDGILSGSLPANTWNQPRAAESVRRQAALGARVVCSGHGPVVKDALAKIPVP